MRSNPKKYVSLSDLITDNISLDQIQIKTACDILCRGRRQRTKDMIIQALTDIGSINNIALNQRLVFKDGICSYCAAQDSTREITALVNNLIGR